MSAGYFVHHSHVGLSALVQKRTSAHDGRGPACASRSNKRAASLPRSSIPVSALHPKADMCGALANVR